MQLNSKYEPLFKPKLNTYVIIYIFRVFFQLNFINLKIFCNESKNIMKQNNKR